MEKINVAELLKDCPKGMELDCTMFDDVKFIRVEEGDKPICIRTGDIYRYLTKIGTWTFDENAKCVIFPKGKNTWEGFVPPCKFKDGDIVYVKTHRQNEYITIFKEIADNHFYKYACLSNQCFSIDKCAVCHLVSVDIMRLATEAETEKLFQAIKDRGYKWDSETKTLEKLVEPKFKAGNKVKNKDNFIVTIVRLDGDYYDYVNEDGQCGVIYIRSQNEWELVPNKFDISSLIPFESRVLFRNTGEDIWKPAIFGCYLKDKSAPYYALGGTCWRYCIPFDANEHLLGTTNDCDEFYKNWK